MGKEIVIFNARVAKKSGTFFISKKSGFPRLTNSLGKFFLAISLVGITLFLLPVVTAELQYRVYTFRSQNEQPADGTSRSKFSFILSPKEDQFELVIPKVGIKTQVLTNINAADEQAYQEILADNAAHAMGSNLPGEGGLVYIFGHSTNSIFDFQHYNPVFYLLKELNFGDEIGIIHQGKVYIYQVAEKKVIQSDDLADIRSDNNQEKLILQTCWPPGTTWKRLLVIAYPERKT